MRARWVGVSVALALLGGAAGIAVAELAPPSPTSSASAVPVPAESPSYPVNEYTVLPDPDVAPLATDLPLRTARFAVGGEKMTASVPQGWNRHALSGRDSWNFAVPDYLNTYLLRLGIIVGDRTSVTAARNNRISNLEDAENNGALQHLVIEERTDDGFTATYIDGGYARVAMERFLPQPGSTQAFATVAVTGRERDRAGMTDLLDRVVASAAY